MKPVFTPGQRSARKLPATCMVTPVFETSLDLFEFVKRHRLWLRRWERRGRRWRGIAERR